MEKRTLTIEEMIANGASWAEISARVKALQKEQAEKKEQIEKKRAEEMERTKKIEATKVAKERLVQAFIDWAIAEGYILREEREKFTAEIEETVDTILTNMRYAFILRKILE